MTERKTDEKRTGQGKEGKREKKAESHSTSQLRRGAGEGGEGYTSRREREDGRKGVEMLGDGRRKGREERKEEESAGGKDGPEGNTLHLFST